jgi:PIN domain nuclease of toxin-antitoxin system
MSAASILLDTCAIIFLSDGRNVNPKVLETLEEAEQNGSIFLSPISAWEIGRGVASGKLAITKEPAHFFQSFRQSSSAKLVELTPELLIASSFLPGRVHKDPFDRILIETARRHELTLLTSDRAILAYGALGHVKTLAC